MSIAAGVGLLAAGLYDSVPPAAPQLFPPESPIISQTILDCRTRVEGSAPIPPPGCDDWSRNRYERPFEVGQDPAYFPFLDILAGELGRAGEWFHLRISLAGSPPSSPAPSGSYAVELDRDLDGRGDLLIMAVAPGQAGEAQWSVAGVQVWEDSNLDVGGAHPSSPDSPAPRDGYDRLRYQSGSGAYPNMVWSRVVEFPNPAVEIAYHHSLIPDDQPFKWWLWAAAALEPGLMDLHDAIDLAAAGEVYSPTSDASTPALQRLDSTCKGFWPGHDDGDPLLCLHDAFIPLSGSTLSPSSTPASSIAPSQSSSPTHPSPTQSPTPSATPTSPVYPTHTSPPTATRRPIKPTATPTPLPITSPPPTPTATNTKSCPPEGCN